MIFLVEVSSCLSLRHSQHLFQCGEWRWGKLKSISIALSERVFALNERVFALSERVFALDVRVECELMWQGQDGGPGIRPGKRARTAAKTAPRRSQ